MGGLSLTRASSLLVFTDMDGTLLDHHDYSFEAARPALQRLKDLGIPVIPVTSKTRAELMPLMKQLALHGPFVVENGAGIYIPKGFFAQQPAGTQAVDDLWCYAQVPPRAHWLQVLNQLKLNFVDAFTHFSQMGVSGVQAATGLPRAAAELACQRDFGEPVQWLGSEEQQAEFISACQAYGAKVLQGGRFLHVAGESDKGVAVRWLCEAFQAADKHDVYTVGLGDSLNDVAMLQAVDQAVVIKGVNSEALSAALAASQVTAHHTQGFGPVGWHAAMMLILDQYQQVSADTVSCE